WSARRVRTPFVLRSRPTASVRARALTKEPCAAWIEAPSASLLGPRDTGPLRGSAWSGRSAHPRPSRLGGGEGGRPGPPPDHRTGRRSDDVAASRIIQRGAPALQESVRSGGLLRSAPWHRLPPGHTPWHRPRPPTTSSTRTTTARKAPRGGG